MYSEIRLYFLFILRLYGTLHYLIERIRRYKNGRKPYKEEDVQNKIVLITGANSGLGKQCVYEMVQRGAAKVILACRNLEEGEKAIQEIQNRTTCLDNQMEVMKLDLSSLESVRTFAEAFKNKCKRLDILINNAGFYDANSIRKKTKDGFELHFGVNHLGHFLLTNLLLDRLRRGNDDEQCSRVVTVSSHAQIFENLNLSDVMLENSSYGPLNFIPYANSKYANSLFAKELARREGKNGIRSYSIAPGMVVTKFYKGTPGIFSNTAQYLGESLEQGCETIIYLAVAKEIDNDDSNGCLYHFQNVFRRSNERLHPDVAEHLWSISEKLVGLHS